MPSLLERAPHPFDPDAAFEAFETWALEQGLTLYPAQSEALIELVTGANVILSTPTGSGKSLVAVAAHFAALAQQQRTVYTAPIKALVSEKFFALVDTFGAQNVGMVTGDSSVNPVSSTVRMGTLMPTPSVSVPQITRSRPRCASCSTRRRYLGSMPAWCTPMPPRTRRERVCPNLVAGLALGLARQLSVDLRGHPRRSG